MGRRYFLPFQNITVGSANVLAAFQTAAAAAAGSIVAIERIEVSQNHNTTSAMQRLALSSRANAGTFTLVSQSPNPVVVGGPASGIAGGTNGLTAAKSGINASSDSSPSYVDIVSWEFNNLGGFLWQPIPEHKIIVPPSTIISLRMLAAPSDTAGWTGGIWIDEVF